MTTVLIWAIVSITVITVAGMICYVTYKTNRYVQDTYRIESTVKRALQDVIKPLEKRIEALETIVTTEER